MTASHLQYEPTQIGDVSVGGTEQPARIFFPALNAVRAYAALSVVVWHMPQLMRYFHVPISTRLYNALSRAFLGGDDAVNLFFVLSGFLITYLLLAERKRTGTVAIGKFYARRALRIWPLYYVAVAIGFFVIPHYVGWANYPKDVQAAGAFGPRLALFLAMLPNVAETLWPNSVPVAHLWSVGVEEQFYLVWPALMKWFGRRVVWLIAAVIALKALSYAAEYHARGVTHHWRYGAWAEPLHATFRVLRSLRLDVLTFGALAAYVGFRAADRPAPARMIFHPIAVATVTALFIACVALGDRVDTSDGGLIHAGVFAWFILSVGAHPNFPRGVLMAPVNFLGRISYGIYVYHVPVIFVLLRFLQRYNITWHTGFTYFKTRRGIRASEPLVPSLGRNAGLLLVVVALTVVTATISFYCFERIFLKLKRRYTIVRSGSAEGPLA